MAEAVKVRGLKEFLRATAKADKETKKRIRARFREVGEIVRDDAASRFGRYDDKTAGGFRPVVRTRGVTVEQRLKRTTGKRGDFGALQMRRGLIPAVESNTRKIEAEFEKALDELADIVED
jgi:hypothetical protein